MSLLSACGGGGGGGDAAPAVPTAALQSAKAVDTAALSAWLAERSLMVAQLVGDELRAQATRGGLGAAGISCSNGDGSRDLSVTADRDGSGSLSIGDHVRIDYSACRVPIFEGLLTGTVELEVTVNTLTPINRAWAADLSTSGLSILRDGTSTPWVLSGGLHAESRMHLDGVDLHAVENDGQALVWQRGASSERMLDFKLVKTLDYVDSTGRVDIAYALESGSLNGRVSVASSNGGITGWIGRQPDAGVLRVTGGMGEVTVRPDTAGGKSAADVGFDGDTNGVAETVIERPWSAIATGFLWWAQGLVPLSSGSTAYPIPAAGVPPLAPYLLSATDEVALDTTIEWAFSINLDPDEPLPTMVLERDAAPSGLPWSRPDDDWGSARVLLQPTLRGARLSLVPTEQLQPGRRYQLRMLRNGPAGVSEQVELQGTRGDIVVLAAGDVYTTREGFVAAARFTPVPSVTPNPGDLSIDATGSFDLDQPIVSYKWRQVSGPPLVIDSVSSPTTLVRVAGGPVGSESLALLELTVVNAAGEKDIARLPVKLLPTSAQTNQLYFRSSPGSAIGSGETRRIVAPSASFTALRVSTERVQIDVVEGNGTEWRWYLTALPGELPQPGTYVDATTAFGGDGNNFRPISTRTELREIEFDVNGEVVKLAADFFHDNGGAFGSVSGAVRFNSAVPAPQ